jgi:hypothetical protein
MFSVTPLESSYIFQIKVYPTNIFHAVFVKLLSLLTELFYKVFETVFYYGPKGDKEASL